MSETALHDYLNTIEKDYKSGQTTEHTYHGALKALLEALDTNVFARNEPKRIKCGAPDYIIERKNLTIGYVEAKDIDLPLDKIEKDEQLKRYFRALDNLILTDYLEFRWYVQGEKRMTARLATPRIDKRLLLDKDGAAAVEQLLHNFLEHSAEPLRKPQELAQRMARLAHIIRDIITTAFEQQVVSRNLRDLYQAFQDVLLPELKAAEFADMFTQTMAYGLFAARYNHTQNRPFRRDDAAREIPSTNPFLRRLFGTIAGPDFDDEPFVGFVDELSQVLAFTDMEAVLADFGKHTHQEDPIVHFYETFLAQYDPKLRELRGVYYTPEPVVSYIVRSVDYLLREHFDCPDGLADTTIVSHSYVDKGGNKRVEDVPRVLILDPATGTGTFLYHVIALIRESYQQMGNAGMWSDYVRQHLLQRLFGFELLMAPYAMAHLKLGMQLAGVDLPEAKRATWAYGFNTDERLGIYLTNTLDEALKRSHVLFGGYISDEANEAARVKQGYPVMVVLGNPPYSGHSANKGPWIHDLLRGQDAQTGTKTANYFEVDDQPLGERNPKWLNDDYVKFMRFAQWRIEKTGYGILAFITNHGYLDNPTFRGMRQSLMQTFDDIYVLNLHGNSKKREHAPDGTKDENVFDIQQGVAIGLFVKRQKETSLSTLASVYHAHLWGVREVYDGVRGARKLVGGKYYWLAEHDVTTTEWTKIEPRSPLYLFRDQDINLEAEYRQGWRITEIFPMHTVGVATGQDANTIALTPNESKEQAESFNLPQDVIKPILYRPFDKRYIAYSHKVITRSRARVMSHMLKGKNRAIVTTRSIEIGRGWEHIFCSSCLIQLHTVSIKEGNYLFPLYTYSPDGSLFESEDQLLPNLSEACISYLSTKLRMRFIPDGKGDLQQTFGPEDIFNYMYAIFHSPTYRERYADFLKIDFPRLPLTSNANLFRELCKLGDRLVGLHLMEKFGKTTTKYPVSGNDMVDKIDYTSSADALEQSRVWINKTQYIEGVPPEVWSFHIGGYQVCQKWLKDRKGRKLEFNDIKHYQCIVASLAETITLMQQIYEVIDEHGGWPIQ